MKLNKVYDEDPLFILKLAIFSKKELNLQHFPNLLLAYASIRRKTQSSLKDYLEKCIKSPQEIVELVDICQILSLIEFDTCHVNNDETIIKKYLEKNKNLLLEDFSKNREKAETSDEFENIQRGRYRGGGRGRGGNTVSIDQNDKLEDEKDKMKNFKLTQLAPFPYPYKLKLSKELSIAIKSILKSFNEEDYIKCNLEKRRLRKVIARRKIVKKLTKIFLKKELRNERLKEIETEEGSRRGRGRGRARGFMFIPNRRLKRKGTTTEIHNSSIISNEIKLNYKRQKHYDIITRPLVTIKKIIRYLKLDIDSFLLDRIRGWIYPNTETEFQVRYLEKTSPYSKNLKFKEINAGLRMCLKPIDNFCNKLKNTDFLIHQILLIKSHNFEFISNYLPLNNITNPNSVLNESYSEDLLRILNTLKYSETITPLEIIKYLKRLNSRNFTKDMNYLNSEDLPSYNYVLSHLFRYTLNKEILKNGNDKIRRLFLIDKSACTDLKSDFYELSYKELAILNSFHYSLESTEIFFFGFEQDEKTPHGVMKFSFDKQDLLKCFNKQILVFPQCLNLDSTPLPNSFIDELTKLNNILDEIFIFSDCLVKKSQSFFSNTNEFLTNLEQYRKNYSPSLKLFSINILSSTCFIDEDSTDLDIYIEGFNVNLPKFCLKYSNMIENVNNYTL